MLNGIDTSDYNDVTDYAAIAASGQVRFWFNKATEGTDYVNPDYETVYDSVRRIGIPYGAYHFFHGSVAGQAQAQAFLNAIGSYEGELLPVVDCEESGTDGVSAATYLQNLTRFINAVDATLSGKKTIVYFGYSFWQTFLGGTDAFAGHPAFPAVYTTTSKLDMKGTGWAKWTLWQYSDGSGLAPIPGIAGGVDRDRLIGNNISAIERA